MSAAGLPAAFARLPRFLSVRSRFVGALCIASLFLLAVPEVTQAQDVTLVSNFDDVSTGNSVSVGETGTFTNVAAQQFTTGANSEGYVLKSLTFRIHSRQAGTSPKVSIYTSVSDKPGSELYTFAGISADTGIKTVAAQANAALSANTAYFVVFEDTDTSTGRWNVRVSQSLGTYDTDSLSDWSMVGRLQSFNGGATWGSFSPNQNIAVKLEGVVNSGTNTAATGEPGITGTPQVGQTLTATQGKHCRHGQSPDNDLPGRVHVPVGEQHRRSGHRHRRSDREHLQTRSRATWATRSR